MSTSEDPSGTSTSPAPDAASTRRSTKFPTVRITGGPHGHDTKVEIDGVEQRGVFRLNFRADVSDAIRVELWRFAKVEVEVEAEVEDIHRVVVKVQDRVWQAIGDGTLPGALRALADVVEESEQSGSTSDTVGVPDRGLEEVSNGQGQEEPAP